MSNLGKILWHLYSTNLVPPDFEPGFCGHWCCWSFCSFVLPVCHILCIWVICLPKYLFWLEYCVSVYKKWVLLNKEYPKLEYCVSVYMKWVLLNKERISIWYSIKKFRKVSLLLFLISFHLKIIFKQEVYMYLYCSQWYKNSCWAEDQLSMWNGEKNNLTPKTQWSQQ